MRNDSLVSVIIPVFNGEKYIVETIESVFNQTYPAVELIVVDDGSTDDTRQILEAYSGRLRYIQQQNSGVSAARNRGVRVARGEYIVFLDADDILLPDKLADQAACLDGNAALGSVHSGWHLVNAQGKLIETREPWRAAPCLDLEAWITYCPFYLPAMMFRREWIERVGEFEANLHQAEDVDFLLRMSLLGCQTVWLERPTVCYRQHESSTMRNGAQQARSITQVMQAFFARPDLPADVRQKENTIMLNTFMWSVWHLYVTGYTMDIAPYLRQSRRYTPESSLETTRLWLERFVRASADRGMPFEKIRTLWPQFKKASDVDETDWPYVEKALNRWLKFMQVLYTKTDK